jgi:hypothetical protein
MMSDLHPLFKIGFSPYHKRKAMESQIGNFYLSYCVIQPEKSAYGDLCLAIRHGMA